MLLCCWIRLTILTVVLTVGEVKICGAGKGRGWEGEESRKIWLVYRKFQNKHPEIVLGFCKFHSICPTWVSFSSCRQEGVRDYSANFDLTMAVIQSSKEGFSVQSIVSLCICTSNSQDCLSGDRERCPGPNTLTEDSLGIPDDQEVDFAILGEWGTARDNIIGDRLAYFKNQFQHYEMGCNSTVKWCPSSALNHSKNTCDRAGSVAKVWQLYAICAPHPPKRCRVLLTLLL